MAKQHFIFDKKTQTYIPVKRKNSNTLRVVASSVFLTLFFAAMGAFYVYHKFVTPQSHSQARMAKEVEQMELQYNLLNKKFEQTHKVLADLQERDNNVYRSFFELVPIDNDTRKVGFGGVDRYDKFSNLPLGDLMKETAKNLDIISKQVVLQSKSLDEVLEAAKDKDEMFKHIPAMQPIANKDLSRLASGYGMRLHPILKIGRMHWGTDFKATSGTPIYATGDAMVSHAGVRGGFGNVVILDHGYGYESLYAHMSKIKARAGQTVKRGDIIGYVGTTGLSSGPHLHYEIRKDGERIDPISFFNSDVSPDEFKILYEKSQEMTVSLD